MKCKVIQLALLGSLAACNLDMSDDPAMTSEGPKAQRAQVTGTLIYRERIALHPAAVAEVWLLDTSLADAPAVEIAYQKIEDPGSPPIAFALDYDPREIREGIQYGVRATIRHAGELLFTSDTHYSVLTRGAGHSAQLTLVMVGRAPNGQPVSSDTDETAR